MSGVEQSPAGPVRVAWSRTGVSGTRPVVLLHGFGCGRTVWDEVAPGLAADHDVISYDQVGASGSDLSGYDERRYARLDGHVDDLVTLLRRLDLHDVALVGHSIGGAVAMLASIAEPERVSALVLIGSSPRYLDDDGYHGGFSQADLDGMFGLMETSFGQWTTDIGHALAAGDGTLAADVSRRFAQSPARIAARSARVTFGIDIRSELPRVSVPTAVLQAQDDFVVPRQTARWMHEQIPGSRYVELATAGHMPHLSDPAETLAAIREHLALTASRP